VTPLKGRDIFGLRAFLAFADGEGDLLPFVKLHTAVTGVVDLTEVNKNVFAAVVGLNEAVTFFAVEPFDGSLDCICHKRPFVSNLFGRSVGSVLRGPVSIERVEVER